MPADVTPCTDNIIRSTPQFLAKSYTTVHMVIQKKAARYRALPGVTKVAFIQGERLPWTRKDNRVAETGLKFELQIDRCKTAKVIMRPRLVKKSYLAHIFQLIGLGQGSHGMPCQLRRYSWSKERVRYLFQSGNYLPNKLPANCYNGGCNGSILNR